MRGRGIIAPVDPAPRQQTVAVVVNTFNDARWLADALDSILAQSRPVNQIIVVDDGSKRSPVSRLARYPGVQLIRQNNQGLAAARNAGLAAVTCDYVIFLDADDRLLPQAAAAGLSRFAERPDAAMVYGAHRRVDKRLRPISEARLAPVGDDAFADLLTGNRVAMHATAMYRTTDLWAIGGFDSSLRLCEDYELYLRLARRRPIVWHSAVVAEYRWHGKNISRRPEVMLRQALAILDRFTGELEDPMHEAAWAEGRKNWSDHYDGIIRAPRPSLMRRLVCLGAKPLRAAGRRVRNWFRAPPRVGRVRFGDFGTTLPISLDFGWDRGLPIDRYYIESFLLNHADDVCGRVLEVGDDAYSRRFGGDWITRQDILHVAPDNPVATIIGDLATPGLLPDAAFDCIVLTQTLHLIFDLHAAVAELHAALRPGGVLLLTVPGISQSDRGQWGENWLWSLTGAAVSRLFSPVFGADGCAVSVHGNVLAATAMLQGLAVAEVDTAKLDVFDPAYPVIVTLRAQKRL